MPIRPGDFDRTESIHKSSAQEHEERLRIQLKQDSPTSPYNGQVAYRKQQGRGGIGPAQNTPIWVQPSPMQESQAEMISRVKREQKLQWFSEPRESLPGVHGSPPLDPIVGRVLLPSPLLAQSKSSETFTPNQQHLETASNVERPRSALHAGDFRQRLGSDTVAPSTPRPQPRSSVQQWISTFPTQVEVRHQESMQQPPQHSSDGINIPSRHRAASYSALSSSYVLRTPTSPLVLQSNSRDLDGDDEPAGIRPASPDKVYRRRTFSPGSTHHLSPTLIRAASSNFSPPYLYRERSQPTQSHDHRKSITYLPNSAAAREYAMSPSRSRQPSVSDGSPLQHAPLVGRYEESILRGRMSTTPSRPLDFVAQIGVLGKGNCKASLRCPNHVTVAFPAVFYDYKHVHDRSSSLVDGPSPYVGQIDLESNAKSSAVPIRVRREASPGSDIDGHQEDMDLDGHASSRTPQHSRHHRRLPKGSYRIPQQGQLQIIIKNPHKTAVKLFLVPYDLTGMESGQKTFIRQRSYSWGPIIDMPLSARKNLGTERPDAALSTEDDPNARPVLRYLIHLHICCPLRGRYYLYKTIRVVFANRVPDGKEKLRVETQLPEPRFSNYKPEVSTPKKLAAPAQIFEPQPAPPISRAASAGELTHRLEDKFLLRRPQLLNSGPESDGVPFQRVLPSFDFRRIPSPQPPSDGDHPMSDDQDPLLSPKTNTSGITDGMSWTAHSTLHNRLSPASTASDGSARHGLGFVHSGSDRSRSSTPRPGEGLLALQLRDWAEQTKTQKPP